MVEFEVVIVEENMTHTPIALLPSAFTSHMSIHFTAHPNIEDPWQPLGSPHHWLLHLTMYPYIHGRSTHCRYL
jgi:hypothetical protein